METINEPVEELESFVRSYLETALWASNDESTPSGGEPLDTNYSIDDIAPSEFYKIVEECKNFLDKAKSLLNGYDLHVAAHDFWLTRNHHGAGFWDGDYEEKVGKLLTDIAQDFGERYLILGDSGKIYYE